MQETGTSELSSRETRFLRTLEPGVTTRETGFLAVNNDSHISTFPKKPGFWTDSRNQPSEGVRSLPVSVARNHL
ncbi:MAG: hypothetical protein F6K47_01805 [Symploca sp. SIO2E6]|nr:hypothetical protein [Symploca sp. SIO2E6]